MAKNEAVFTKDLENKKLTVVRSFDAAVQKVWDAWTKAEILDLWWAPRPYKAVTKTMDFRPGGMWLYAMTSPAGEKHWCRVDIHTVAANSNFTSSAMFCDEEGNINDQFPVMHWNNTFNQSGDQTTVQSEISFNKIADMETIIQMGFEAGYAMGLGNLDEYLAM
ncbi:ATPase [Flavipsychrobacter stenotrophus]|uniref:ATPase n=1 Tax=Flavipsychrobacter stenotrophus TaxID=2077091 RepID=A0A2S7SQJ4_9BACT|nr:SRPBCC domain-containing protein [Flavipsychrobacter stenotrophus]PQJ08897.1 ATPase [Flavipsychrobacter stenotrophus]